LVSNSFKVLVEELGDVLLRGEFAFLLDEPFSAQLQQFARNDEGRSTALVHALDQPRKRFVYDRGQLLGRAVSGFTSLPEPFSSISTFSCSSLANGLRQSISHRLKLPSLFQEWLICRIWYSTSRTLSDHDAHRATLMIARSALSQSSPAPSARRKAALGLDRFARPSKSRGRAAIALATMGRAAHVIAIIA
jgi:hypothetical protein